MDAENILHNLKCYDSLLDKLYQLILNHAQAKPGYVRLKKVLSNSFQFITLELRIVIEQADSISEALFCRISFQLQHEVGMLKDMYCDDHTAMPIMEGLIKDFHDQHWQENPTEKFSFTDDILQYLRIADDIARQVHNCAAGDHYSPGNFSRISMEDGKIILSQVNHMNSKSLAHKENYSLRSLEFIIPTASRKISMYDYKIGDMLINFSDRSSANNKQCGEKILKRITELKTG